MTIHSFLDINVIYYSVMAGGKFLRPVDVAGPKDTDIATEMNKFGLNITVYTPPTVRQRSILLNGVVITQSAFEQALADVWQSVQGHVNKQLLRSTRIAWPLK